MPISASDLKIYGAADRPEDDSSTVGGAIDLTARPLDAELAAPANLEAVSSGADTRTVTARYRGADGVIYEQGVTLNGVTPVAWDPAISAERLITLELSTTHGSNTVIVRVASGGAVQHTFAASETNAFRLFTNAISSAAPKTYYEKLFFRNNHDTLALMTAYLRATADPLAKLAVAICTSVDDSGTSTNRLTVPAAGIGSWTEENIDLAVPGTNLAAESAIGFWVRYSLGAAEAPQKSYGTYQLRGGNA